MRHPLSVLSSLLIATCAAQAQVHTLGKGWVLDGVGSITSAPAEVVSGHNSIKGAYFGIASYTTLLGTDPTYIRFASGQAYTLTFRYRVLSALSRGLQFGFFSSTGSAAQRLLNNPVLAGPPGASGTASATIALGPDTDHQILFKIVGTGAIAIDDIQVTDASGRVVSLEDAEGPALATGAGPLRFRITDARSLIPDASAKIRSAALRDLDGDGYPEVILTLTAPRPSNTPIEPIVVEASGAMRVATSAFFPAGAPTVKHSPVTVFADIDNDGLPDILFADAGSDAPPWEGSRIGVALNMGGGRYRDVSSLIPGDQQTPRSYSLAAGDIDGDGRVEIVLPDQGEGTRTALLRWNGSGFDEQRQWIAPTVWGAPTYLSHASWMVVADLDQDGRNDLLVAGQGAPPTASFRVLYGAADGLAHVIPLELPVGTWGNGPLNAPVVQGADVGPVVVADFNNDGLPDIFAIEEQVTTYQPGVFSDTSAPDYADLRANGGTAYGDIAFQVLINRGARRYDDVTANSSAINLGRRYYYGAAAVDINNDGFLDVVAVYQTKLYAGVQEQWGTTVFLNDGTGAFQVVDGADLLAAVETKPSNGQRWNLGSFFPTTVTSRHIEGVVFESIGGCGGLGFCFAKGLNLYKVVADDSIGTGPGFADSAALGVPGFNEFYYLRHYPDALAAVRAGRYASGLAYYLAVGRERGDLPSAAAGVPLNLTASSAGSNVTLSWSAPSIGTALSYRLEAGSAPGLSDIADAATGTASTTFAASAVAPGTYHVRIRAVLPGGAVSAPSNEVVVTVGATRCNTAPSAPSEMTASIAGSTVMIRWTAALGAPRSYVLEAGSAPGRTDIASVDLGRTTRFTLPGVGPGTYYGRVRAKNDCGTSGPSNEVTVRVLDAARNERIPLRVSTR